ncbi:MAG TPA: ECF transporter S component [Bacteroidota bacterium]|nr:ECF transporter S component [Bacteroidota bacterium]
MSNHEASALSLHPRTLSLSGARAMGFESFLIALAVVLPVVAHLVGAPVRYLLPMHWPVILAGLVYGWRGGALTGLLAPVVSYGLSGYPLPHILPSMTFELLTYGLVAGILRERLSLNAFLSAGIALIAGRIVFVLSVLVFGGAGTGTIQYFQSALTPGLVGALCQAVALPFVASWWIKQEQTYKNGKKG